MSMQKNETSKLFTLPDAWSGGNFELLLNYDKISIKATRAVLHRLWNHPTLEGCWLERDIEPEYQPCFKLSDWKINKPNSLFGIANLPNQSLCNCGSYLYNDGDSTWLSFGVSMGALGQFYPIGGYPFGGTSDVSWIIALNEWLADIAQTIFDFNAFSTGEIGFETDGAFSLQSSIPEERWNGYLRNEAGKLVYYPQNVFASPFQF